jgi:hypothetical protein
VRDGVTAPQKRAATATVAVAAHSCAAGIALPPDLRTALAEVTQQPAQIGDLDIAVKVHVADSDRSC